MNEWMDGGLIVTDESHDDDRSTTAAAAADAIRRNAVGWHRMRWDDLTAPADHWYDLQPAGPAAYNAHC